MKVTVNLNTDKKLGTFVTNVVSVLLDKNRGFHVPDSSCFKGTCGQCRTAGTTVNWNAILQLAIWFWKHGPDIDDGWKRAARNYRVDPDELHETLLGVFIGGSTVNPAFYSDENGWWRATGNFNKLTNPGIHIPGARLTP